MSNHQLALDLGHRPLLGRDDFLVAPCNAEAVAWAECWPQWPAHALCFYGPIASGKSHILSLFAEFHGLDGTIFSAASLSDTPDEYVAGRNVVLVDNLDQLNDERALFHLWNLTKETGRFLVMAGEVAPGRMQFKLPDLKSRLNSSMAIGIGAPDDALLAAILIKQISDRQLKISEEVAFYALSRLERSFTAIRQFVAAVDQASLKHKRPITLPLVKRVMDSMDASAKDTRQGVLSI